MDKSPVRNKAWKTISIGGATFDLFIPMGQECIGKSGTSMIQIPLGSKRHIHGITGTCGGGASNTAVGFSRLGCSASFCGVVGDDQWGERLMKNMVEEGVDTTGATIVEGETSSFSLVLLPPEGERAILYDPGTNAYLHQVTFDREHAATVDWIYLNHIQPESCVIEDEMLNILAESHQLAMTWNPGGCQIDVGMREKKNRRLVTRTNILILNGEEILLFTQKKNIPEALRCILAEGVRIACATLGKRGAIITDGTAFYYCPTKKVQVIDTTGAGDAFGIGITWAILQKLDLHSVLHAGTLNASSVVEHIGAQKGLLTDTEMRLRMKETLLPVEVLPISTTMLPKSLPPTP